MLAVATESRITTSHEYFCDAATAAVTSATAAAASTLPLPNDKHLHNCTHCRDPSSGRRLL